MLQFVILRNGLTWIVTVIRLESSSGLMDLNHLIRIYSSFFYLFNFAVIKFFKFWLVLRAANSRPYGQTVSSTTSINAARSKLLKSEDLNPLIHCITNNLFYIIQFCSYQVFQIILASFKSSQLQGGRTILLVPSASTTSINAARSKSTSFHSLLYCWKNKHSSKTSNAWIFLSSCHNLFYFSFML